MLQNNTALNQEPEETQFVLFQAPDSTDEQATRTTLLGFLGVGKCSNSQARADHLCLCARLFGCIQSCTHNIKLLFDPKPDATNPKPLQSPNPITLNPTHQMKSELQTPEPKAPNSGSCCQKAGNSISSTSNLTLKN